MGPRVFMCFAYKRFACVKDWLNLARYSGHRVFGQGVCKHMQGSVLTLPIRVMRRAALPTAVLSLCLVTLAQTVTADHLLSLPERLSDIGAVRWILAVSSAAASFWAVAQYDALAHKVLGTGIAPARAQVTGAVGIALGQTLGIGVVTGALARWRMLADLSLAQAAKVSAFVSASFVICWAALTAVACLTLPAPGWAIWPALAICAALPVLPVILFLFPVINCFGVTLHLPSLRISGAILLWALIDTALAAATLFVLLPAGAVSFAAFLPLFLIALGSGLISNTPGGVGPFELVLLSAMPTGDPGAIMAAILGYRIVYYALPAICAGVALMRPFAHAQAIPPDRQAQIADPGEAAVVAQNGGAIVTAWDSTLALWPTAQTVTQFTDPVTGARVTALSHLRHAAERVGKLPLIYKCSARMAVAARASGWCALHIADEAIIDVVAYDLATPSRRSLRRKLRNADKAGIVVRSGPPMPVPAMARIDSQWQSIHGTARGGSMGRYCPTYAAHQWVGCAYVQGRLVGFVTAHRGAQEWCLDIMRHGRDLPDGTMHALVHAAISAARLAGAARFSLAAVPACPAPHSALWRWAAVKVAERAGGRGLRQFKSAFAPYWSPRYAAARSWGALALGLADLARTIHRPPPLGSVRAVLAHNVDENYELDSITVA